MFLIDQQGNSCRDGSRVTALAETKARRRRVEMKGFFEPINLQTVEERFEPPM